MKIEEKAKWDISVCGLNCAKCDIYEAGHGNKKLMGEILEWFRKERNETLMLGQISVMDIEALLTHIGVPTAR